MVEHISVHNPFSKTLLGVPAKFPRGYGNTLYLYNEDETIEYYVDNLSYDDLVDAIELGIISKTIEVETRPKSEPEIVWGYETKYETYKYATVIDKRLPPECLISKD